MIKVTASAYKYRLLPERIFILDQAKLNKLNKSQFFFFNN